ncbi:MAG: hypothetical protein EBR09_14060 [Proteobacteria bacterium]|nr:hypothetical protein [Pseudomonadota bacterium]
MVGESIESIIGRAKESPDELKTACDSAAAESKLKFVCLDLFAGCAERFDGDWSSYDSLKKSVDESLLEARKLYKETLKKTEASALHGKPKLYWLAKYLFAKLRKQSLEYQIKEAEIKIESLVRMKTELTQILKKMTSGGSTYSVFDQLVSDSEFSEAVSKKHAVDLHVEWERFETAMQQNEELTEKGRRHEIEQSVADALVSGIKSSGPVCTLSRPVRKVDSPKMLLSRLAHVGFANRPRLKMLIERGEHSARHAEVDLDKVREGLRLAAEASVDGRATSMSREWIEYCRSIAARYEELAEPDVTPR